MELDKEGMNSSNFQYMGYPSGYSALPALRKYFFASDRDGSSLLGKGLINEAVYLKTKKPTAGEKLFFNFVLHIGNAG